MSRAEPRFRVVLTVPVDQHPAGRLRIPSAELDREQADRLWRHQIESAGPDAFGPHGVCRTVIVAAAEYQPDTATTAPAGRAVS